MDDGINFYDMMHYSDFYSMIMLAARLATCNDYRVHLLAIKPKI